MSCTCPGWLASAPFIDNVISMHLLRCCRPTNGVYMMPEGVRVFKFCPWCATELPPPPNGADFHVIHPTLEWTE